MVTVIRDGISYNVTDGSLAYKAGDEGWAMPAVIRPSQRGPQQHGDTDKGFKLQPRIGRLIFKLPGSSLTDLYDKRDRLIGIFAPADDPITLHWPYHGGRRIDCHYIADMQMPTSEREGWMQKVAITLKASDPTYYDPTARAETFNLGGGGGALVVPMTVPHTVGASSIDQTKGIAYPGTWHAYPSLIRITGPITNAVITNETTGEKLDFTGTTIADGDYYDLDLRYGYKTVVDSLGANKYADLTNDSDLSTWHLEKAPEPGTESDPRINSVRVQGTAITSTTKVEISYRARYVGI